MLALATAASSAPHQVNTAALQPGEPEQLLIPPDANLVSPHIDLDKWSVRHGVPSRLRATVNVSLWTSPTGRMVESVRTRTDPAFVFAYNPFDKDMQDMLGSLVLEPALTRAWHETTWECCAAPGGLVVDVGGNYGYYTLYSAALGCSVVVFEPVDAYQEIMRLGLALNPGFASKVRLFGNVVYDLPGEYDLNVPTPTPRKPLALGMTGMAGIAGVLKTTHTVSTTVKARAMRIDDVVRQDVCLLKADVEGYEPQVVQTAAQLLNRRRVGSVQVCVWMAHPHYRSPPAPPDSDCGDRPFATERCAD